MDDVIVAVDIGTSKVSTLIGRVNKLGQIEVLGKGLEPVRGIQKGTIVDVDAVAASIKRSVEHAENISAMKVGSAFVNLSGIHSELIENRAVIEVSSSNQEISAKDVELVIKTALSIEVPENRQVVGGIPRQFIVDGYDEIVDPIGMIGTRLEADIDIVTGKLSSVRNIVKSMEKAGVKVNGFVTEVTAKEEVIVSEKEKEQGVLVIDIGGSVTEVSMFKDKKLYYHDSILVGGAHITNDIAVGLNISKDEAEKIKKYYEIAMTSLVNNDQEITVFDLDTDKPKKVMVSEVIEIIEARVYEIFYLCFEKMKKLGIEKSDFSSGIVLAGAGVSYFDGGIQIAQQIFEMPVRIASMKELGILKHEFAVAAGMIKYINRMDKFKTKKQSSGIKEESNEEEGVFKRIINWIMKLIDDLF